MAYRTLEKLDNNDNNSKMYIYKKNKRVKGLCVVATGCKWCIGADFMESLWLDFLFPKPTAKLHLPLGIRKVDAEFEDIASVGVSFGCLIIFITKLVI